MGASGASRGRPPTGVSARADRRDDARREETPRERAANARRARRRGRDARGGARVVGVDIRERVRRVARLVVCGRDASEWRNTALVRHR